jgi:hypothetical protein
MKITVHRSQIAILLTGDAKAQLNALLDKAEAKHNGYINVSIELPRRPRTTGERSQNRALNGYIQQICEETGNDFGVVKTEIKHRALRRGYPFLEKNGIIMRDIYGREMGISEADSSVEECGLLIEEAIQLASELDIKLEGLDG